MNPLTFDNPVFRYYAIAAALMIVKMMSQGWITVFRMITVKGGYRYPEDAQRSLANPHPSPEQLLPNEYVERSRRMHGNDVENTPLFLVAGLALRLHCAEQRHGSLCFRRLRTLPFCPFLCRADGAAARGARLVLDCRLSCHLSHGRCGALDRVEALMEFGPIPLVALNAPTELSNQCLILGGSRHRKLVPLRYFLILNGRFQLLRLVRRL